MALNLSLMKIVLIPYNPRLQKGVSVTTILNTLPKTSPLLLGPLFLLSAFFLIMLQGVDPLKPFLLLTSGLAITALLGLRSLFLVIPLLAFSFYTLLPFNLWSLGLFFLVSLSYFQSALALNDQDDELKTKEELLKERYVHSLHEKEALNVQIAKELSEKSIGYLHAKEENKTLAKTLELARGELKQLTAERESLLREKTAYLKQIGDLEALKEDYFNLKEALKASNLSNREKDLELASLKQKIEQLELTIPDQEAIKQVIVREMNEHIETIEREKSLLESTVSRLQGELEEWQASSETIINPSEHRRLQGMYNQLREQFEAKSNLLNETRKELFQVQEQAHVLAKQVNEYQLTGEGIPQLTLEIAHLLSQQEEAKNEIIRLEELISSLITRKLS